MTKEDYDKATTLQEQIKNCDKLLTAFDLSIRTPRNQYVSIINENEELYKKLVKIIGDYKDNLQQQFNNL